MRAYETRRRRRRGSQAVREKKRFEADAGREIKRRSAYQDHERPKKKKKGSRLTISSPKQDLEG